MDTLTWELQEPSRIARHPATVFGAPHGCGNGNSSGICFDGVGDGLLLAVNPLHGRRRFSCMVEFCPEPDGPAEQRFLHAGTVHQDRALLELRMNSDGRWYLDVYLSIAGWSCALRDSSRLHTAGRWYSATLAFDGRELSGAVDGVTELRRAAALPDGYSPLSGDHCSIGMRQNQVSFFRGAIRRIVWSTEP